MTRFLSALLLLGFLVSKSAGVPLVIAHRGASGYLPEHSLAAAAAAHSMGADFIEQDVVLTKDSQAIVLHDIHLDTVTDVAQKYPDRARGDGRYYAIDFTLAEIKTLRLGERIDIRTGKAVYPDRFPIQNKLLTIPTLEEEILLIQGLNESRDKQVGVYPEIKAPAWHRSQGKDISEVVLDVLKKLGYEDADDAIFLQCFDAAELKRIRNELACRLRLVQLIGKDNFGSNAYAKMRTPEGLREIATYAQGIGPAMDFVISGNDANEPVISTFVDDAQALGLVVHPYTFRADAMPSYVESFDLLTRLFSVEAGVDGLFTDFPDLTRQALKD